MDIAIGSNILRNTNGIFFVQDLNLIHIEENEDTLQLSMEMYSPAGTQVAKLERNTWVNNEQERFELKADPHSLLLVDKTLKGVVIQLKREENKPISIPQAKFYLPSGAVSTVTEESWQVGSKMELKGADVDLQGGGIEIQ